MIISGEIPDPIDARRDPEAAHVICRLDGKQLDNATAASAREGWVDVYVKDQDGRFGGAEWIIERRHGRVELEWKAP